MGRPKENTTNESRPEPYVAQPGFKAVLSLADFNDEHLFAELRRRGYAGELTYSKVIMV